VEVISIRVPSEIKKKMREMKHINWSELIRQYIIEIIEREESRNLARALLLNEKNVIIPDKGFNSTEEIRKWREKVRWR